METMKSLSTLLIIATSTSEAFVPSSSKVRHDATVLYSAHQAQTTNYRDSGIRLESYPQEAFPAGTPQPQQQQVSASPFAPAQRWFDPNSPSTSSSSSDFFNDIPQQQVEPAGQLFRPVVYMPETTTTPPDVLHDLPQQAEPTGPLVAPTRSAPPQDYERPRQWYENQFKRNVMKENSSQGPELWYEPSSPAIAYPTERVQGAGSRSTWHTNPQSKSSQVVLHSARPYAPIEAEVKLRSGPDDTPRKMRVFSEDGFSRPVQASFTNSRAYSQMVDVMNQAPMEFPLEASISETQADVIENGAQIFQTVPTKMCKIQGQSLKTFSFDAFTEEIRVNLESDGLPVMAKIEVLQGPGAERQVFEVVSDDGAPWEGLITIPGGASSLLIRNTGPMEFPIYCSAEAQKYMPPPRMMP